LSTRNGVSAAVAVRPADAHRGTLARWRWLLGVVAGGPGGGGGKTWACGVWRWSWSHGYPAPAATDPAYVDII
jgi:hypothetical protein